MGGRLVAPLYFWSLKKGSGTSDFCLSESSASPLAQSVRYDSSGKKEIAKINFGKKTKFQFFFDRSLKALQ